MKQIISYYASLKSELNVLFGGRKIQYRKLMMTVKKRNVVWQI